MIRCSGYMWRGTVICAVVITGGDAWSRLIGNVLMGSREVCGKSRRIPSKDIRDGVTDIEKWVMILYDLESGHLSLLLVMWGWLAE